MHIDEKTIKQALLTGERVTLECKTAQSNVPADVWRSYSAFANTYGGLILLGVHEDLKENDIAKRFTITGVDNPEKIRKDFWNTINSPEKVNVNLLQDEDVDIFDMDGKMVVAIRVPRADYNTRPVYINNNPLRGTFIRNHEGDYHCPEEMVTMMMRDANHDGNDRLFLKHYIGTENEFRLNGVIEKASLLAYSRRIRMMYKKRSLSDRDERRVEHYTWQVRQLADKLDTLLF